MELKPRPQYLGKLVAARGNGLIKVVTGMRRCGKSSLLTLFRQYLLQHDVDADHIIMMNLESFQYASFTFEDLHREITGRMRDDRRYYVLLDEVQLVDKWERAVNALHADTDADIVITGSNAYLLSGQLATLLSGRYMEINVFPLSLAEFMDYTGMSDSAAAFERYTRYGGLPPVVDQGVDQGLAHTVLSGIYDTIMVRDITQFLQIRNPMVFNDVACYLADTAGSPVSTSKIENRLRSAHRPASNDTIERYMEGLVGAFLFSRAQRIDVKGGGYLQGLSKYYPADLGIRNMLLGYPSGDFGFLLENAVYNELKVRGYQIRVGKLGNAEIDFVATRRRDDLTEERLYIQVSASILDEGTRGRELAPLRSARDLSVRRMVLTLDRFGLGEIGGVSVVNAIDWMLDA
ncbi:ATP-binding protein [Bifidobacterium sp. 64T4]|uniref:ATP-binding protein n=1 Tax=Bifidobacterium pongonis TaxID=2834432 RepID=UPI001C59F605|nr:ATP-binding protein [Bifidobacterium pongonis]MBW3094764.1 ATP-binding protein [Bifidobacterium pongonis]